jgi:hypothetical protein
VSHDGATYTATATYADLLAAMGSDIGQMSKSIAAGIAQAMQADGPALADLYERYFRKVETDVTIKVGDDGLLDSIRYEVDLGGFFPEMLDHAEEIGLGRPTAEQLADAKEQFADTTFAIESEITFEPEDDLEIPPAPATDEDRTDAWVAFLQKGGF